MKHSGWWHLGPGRQYHGLPADKILIAVQVSVKVFLRFNLTQKQCCATDPPDIEFGIEYLLCSGKTSHRHFFSSLAPNNASVDVPMQLRRKWSSGLYTAFSLRISAPCVETSVNLKYCEVGSVHLQVCTRGFCEVRFNTANGAANMLLPGYQNIRNYRPFAIRQVDVYLAIVQNSELINYSINIAGSLKAHKTFQEDYSCGGERTGTLILSFSFSLTYCLF